MLNSLPVKLWSAAYDASYIEKRMRGGVPVISLAERGNTLRK
jgi:hypothetical protein